ncbi:hypothetical protein CVV68_22475 [Arthrobacter livingstonensis]|uniref:Uncharacterized protein n=1 Tax=Arthrobacter livingstonensis TaxID=670078 RepID=A0A2V5KZX8_9MICC|nr:hypothetical protein CVV68_22475 [Arthrobacter livingstonensis]
MSEDDELGRATVRELIVKLALTEDQLRSTANPGRIAALARREQAIVAALHQHELITKGPCHPPCRAQDSTTQTTQRPENEGRDHHSPQYLRAVISTFV